MNEKIKIKSKMLVKLVTISFFSCLLTILIIAALIVLGFIFGVWELKPQTPIRPVNTWLIIGFGSLGSVIIGIILSTFIFNRYLKPIGELKKMTSKVAKGDFTVQVENIPDNEFKEFFEEFNIMVQELRKNEVLKNDFVSNVSHEYKTPLSVIEGYSTLLQDPSVSEEEKQKYVLIIKDATKKMSTLVNNVLKISKLDARKISTNVEEYRLDEQIRECILFYEEEWTRKNIEFDINMDETIVKSDKNLLVNVWDNLIGNAIKYTNNDSKISISLVEEEKFIKTTISDQGIGISNEDLPYIFDKFYQSDKSRKSEGNGLGLTLVKKIIDLVDGKIEVESELEKGTTFKVYIKK